MIASVRLSLVQGIFYLRHTLLSLIHKHSLSLSLPPDSLHCHHTDEVYCKCFRLLLKKKRSLIILSQHHHPSVFFISCPVNEIWILKKLIVECVHASVCAVIYVCLRAHSQINTNAYMPFLRLFGRFIYKHSVLFSVFVVLGCLCQKQNDDTYVLTHMQSLYTVYLRVSG